MPIPRVRPTGVTAIETMVGAVTVSDVLCEMLARDAVMVVVPAAAPVANPLALIVAVAVVDELHITRFVRSELLPSL